MENLQQSYRKPVGNLQNAYRKPTENLYRTYRRVIESLYRTCRNLQNPIENPQNPFRNIQKTYRKAIEKVQQTYRNPSKHRMYFCKHGVVENTLKTKKWLANPRIHAPGSMETGNPGLSTHIKSYKSRDPIFRYMFEF